MRMNVSGLCGVLGLLLGGAAQAGVERLPEKTTEGARPDEARRAVLAMKTACSVPVMSRVYRPRPDCPPRRAAVLKLGDRAVVALRAELVENVAQRAAEAKPRPVFAMVDSDQVLVNALQQIGSPAAVNALLDVVATPGVTKAPWDVLVPAHSALQALTGANKDLKVRSQQDLPQVAAAWSKYRAEHAAPAPAANAPNRAPTVDQAPVAPAQAANPAPVVQAQAAVLE